MATKKAASTPSKPTRAQLYSQAEANLRTAHREEFEASLARLYTEHGYYYKARLTAEERAELKRQAEADAARRKIQALVAKHGNGILEFPNETPAVSG